MSSLGWTSWSDGGRDEIDEVGIPTSVEAMPHHPFCSPSTEEELKQYVSTADVAMDDGVELPLVQVAQITCHIMS